MELGRLGPFTLSVVRKEELSAIRVFYMYYNYSTSCRYMKTCPLFGRSPLFGVSVKREFTVQFL